MSDHLKKPIIINLIENKSHKTNNASAIANLLTKSLFRHQIFEHCSRRTNNISMVSAPDDEMRNDFKWLINFNIRKIMKHSLDAHPMVIGKKSFQRQRVISCRKNIRNDQDYNLKELIKQCLTEMEGVTVKEIHDWISEKYPNFKPNEYGWKNFVRKTLLQDPCFRKKNSKNNGKYLWCFNKGDSDRYEQKLLQNEYSRVSESPLNEQIISFHTRHKRDTSTDMRKTKESNNLENDSFYASIVDAMPAKTTWMESVDNVLGLESRYFIEDRRDEEESMEFYEMTMPLQSDILDKNCE